jgi:hypothetical protein
MKVMESRNDSDALIRMTKISGCVDSKSTIGAKREKFFGSLAFPKLFSEIRIFRVVLLCRV